MKSISLMGVPFLTFISSSADRIASSLTEEFPSISIVMTTCEKYRIIINITDFETIQNNFNNLINYIWEFPLHKKIILELKMHIVSIIQIRDLI